MGIRIHNVEKKRGVIDGDVDVKMWGKGLVVQKLGIVYYYIIMLLKFSFKMISETAIITCCKRVVSVASVKCTYTRLSGLWFNR